MRAQDRRRQEAKDGTVKYLRMADGNCIETVVFALPLRQHGVSAGGLLPHRAAASARPLRAGRVRDLEAGEICSEIYTAQKDIGSAFPIVLMGIGEPLDNFDSDEVSGEHHLARGREHRDAQHQPFLRSQFAQNRPAGRKSCS